MKKVLANLPASVRQRLLNLAAERNEDFGLVLSRYGLERFLYRLSISPDRESFVLKGALLLQVWTEETYRPTRDLDLLGKGMSNVSYQKVFAEICSQDVEDDGLSLPSEKIRVERIRDEEAYEGVRVLLEARLGNVRIPLQIDVGFGDAVVPAPEELEFPTLLKGPAPKLKAYPKESVVAEKFEAIVKLGMANSRMKDFMISGSWRRGLNSRMRRSPRQFKQHSKPAAHRCPVHCHWHSVQTSGSRQASKRNGRRSCERVALTLTPRWRRPSESFENS